MTAEQSPAQHSRSGQHRQYPRAPIVEAILQIDFPSAEVSNEAVSAAATQLSSIYPQRHDLQAFSAHIEIGMPGAASMSAMPGVPDGAQLQDANSHRLVRAFRNAISFHETAPYQGWEQFVNAAKVALAAYEQHVPTRHANRIGLRYINRLDMPEDAGDLRTWIRILPDIPEDLPQIVSSYSMQMAMPQHDLPGVVAVIRQAILQSQEPSIYPFVLDIEIFCQTAVASGMIWTVVDTLHERENMIFERTITDRVRGLIG